jgi:hypothetical protein
MNDIHAIEMCSPAATRPRATGNRATTAVAERRTAISDTIPYHPKHFRLTGDPSGRRQEPGLAECPILPEIRPGQVWLVEHASADLHLSPLAHKAISAANVVIYDRALYATVAANLPLGGYAEPASSRDGLPSKTFERCIQFARDGWSVVWLGDQKTPRDERIGRLVDCMISAGCPPFMPVTLFVYANGNTLQQTEAELRRIGILVDATTPEGRLAIAFGAVDAGAAPHLHAISSNGLAG